MADGGSAGKVEYGPGVEERLAEALAGGPNTVLEVGESGDSVLDFARSVAAGLAYEPRRLDCRFLYDVRGSRLYEEICEQPEYYPARTVAAILEGCAGEVRALAGPATLMELGSGNSLSTVPKGSGRST